GETFSYTDAERQQPAALIAESRGDEARMEAVRSDARACELPGELAREEDVAQLRSRVNPVARSAKPCPFPQARTIGTLGLQIVEVERSRPMRIGARVDHASRRGGQQALSQGIGKNEVGEVVQRERALEAVLGELAEAEHGASVVDEHVDAWL